MIALFIYVKYKPLYRVTLNGKVIGYVESKGKMQEKIEEADMRLKEAFKISEDKPERYEEILGII